MVDLSMTEKAPAIGMGKCAKTNGKAKKRFHSAQNYFRSHQINREKDAPFRRK